MDTQTSNVKNTRNYRNSNLELLRIISMLLIITHHYSVHGGFDLTGHELTTNKIIVQILSLGGKLGVNCFILITGYFMINSKFKFEKLIKLIAEVFFYSVLSIIIFYGFGLMKFDIKTFIKSFLPITYSMYWFATAYVVMYIFTPFINLFINNLTQKNHLKLITTLIILWSIIPTFTNGSPGYSNLGWFITIYIIASYIRLYPNSYFEKCKANMTFAILSYAIIILSVIVFDILGSKINFFAKNATYFAGMTNIVMLICSITLFLGYKNLKINYNKLINKIAVSMFGVYLIHDNTLVRPFIWQQIFKNRNYFNSPFLFLHAFITIIIVFISCVLIDQIRLYIFERPLLLFIHNRQDIINRIIKNYKCRISKSINNFITEDSSSM